MLKLTFDNREKELISIFQKKYPQTQIQIAPLDIGDIVVFRENEPIVLIERKTKADLAASIIDGRYRNQKYRILENYGGKTTIIYLIERFYTGVKNARIPDKNLLAALTNAILRDNIQVYHTHSSEDSAEFIAEIFEKTGKLLTENKLFYAKLENTRDDTVPMDVSEEAPAQNRPAVKYGALVEKRRGDNITPENALIFQLTAIPKVGANAATAIHKVYSTMAKLTSAFSETNKPELLLAEIQVSEKKRLGKVLAKQIYNYISGKSDLG